MGVSWSYSGYEQPCRGRSHKDKAEVLWILLCYFESITGVAGGIDWNEIRTT